MAGNNDEQAYKIKRKNIKLLWQLMIQKLAGYKPTQTAVSDPTASGQAIEFISSVSQNANGVIAPSKKTVRSMGAATSSTAGTSGLVPAPSAGDQDKYLRGDGTWGEIETSDGTVPFSFFIQNGHLYMVYPDDATSVPTASINAAGHLILTYAN